MRYKPGVIVVGPFPPTTGGVTTFMLNLIQSSQKNEWKFTCHSTSRPVRKKPYRGQVSYSGFLQGGLGRAVASALVTMWHAISYPVVLLRSGASVAQIQSSDYFAFWEASLYVAMTRALGRPAVVRCGGAFDTFYEGSSQRAQSLIRRALNSADAIVVQSAYWRDYFGRLTDPSKLTVIPNGVPPPPPAPERGRESSTVTALFICGTESARKGIEELMSMAPKIRGHVHVRCIATPEEIRRRLTESGLTDVIAPLGVLDREDLDVEYRSADMFLLPSHGEGFPNSLLEAMAAALPVIVTPVGAVPEIVEEGVNGLVIPVADPEALTKAVLRLAGDKAERLRMGAANRQKVIDSYDLDLVCERFGQVWRRAMERRTGETR